METGSRVYLTFYPPNVPPAAVWLITGEDAVHYTVVTETLPEPVTARVPKRNVYPVPSSE